LVDVTGNDIVLQRQKMKDTISFAYNRSVSFPDLVKISLTTLDPFNNSSKNVDPNSYSIVS